MLTQEELAAQPVDTVVLAGSINRIELFPGNRPGRKALVELCGRPLIAYVLDALQEARGVRRVLVVGAREVVRYALKWEKVEAIPEGHSLIRNSWRGLQFAQTDRVLFCNPDQPLLRTEMVDDFLARALAVEADVVTSWARQETLGRYVEGEHKFAEFGDGSFAHGNLFLVRRSFPDIQQVRARIDRLYRARKSNIRFAWELGPALFGRFLIAKMWGHLPTLEHTLEIAGEHFGLKLGAVISPYPEIVLDIDEPDDYAAVVRYLTEVEGEACPRPDSGRPGAAAGPGAGSDAGPAATAPAAR